MSLATSAAPVAVRRPATAQLLLPAAGARGTLPDTAAAALPVRTSSTSAGGTAGSAALTAPCAGATGASQLVPAGYRKLKPHFKRAAQRASKPRVDLLAQDLAPQAVRLQIPPHRMLDEDRVLRAPRERGCAQHPVLPRASGKVCDPGVHAARVGLEQRALGGGCLREHLAGDPAKPEQAGPAVLLESHPAEQLRQLPGGEPPREVHLEIAVLRVHETAGVREVCAVGGLDGGHAA